MSEDTFKPNDQGEIPVDAVPGDAPMPVVEETAAPVGKATIVDMEATPAAEQFPTHDDSTETSQ